ncbi:MAG: F0F1 ATP synthase subunit epsilon [Acutalibacteraceae bacterium]|nr:F0F1 ATP synthase subunit epsilon [Clostridia bacterium]MEE3449180.1 F0F1 ATP synthase subunit epsilon [Acutalibacteraceae bacterium]
MSTFKLVVSSPDGDKFNGEAVMIKLRGVEGELAVLAGHIPFITSVLPCECKIELEDGTKKIAKTEGGILTVTADKTTLLTGMFDFNE